MNCDVAVEASDDCEPPGIVVSLPSWHRVAAYASSESSCCSDSDSASRPGPAPKEFRCSLCNSCFSRPQNLKSHIRRKHVGSENVVCPVCRKILSSKSALKKHLLVHSDETPFSCAFCNSAFRQKFELERHLDCSHGDRELADQPKPFSCTVCCRQFAYHSSLAAHSRSHRRTLACDQCDRAFASATDLRRHRLAIHQPHEDRPFVCHLCPERFCRKEHRDHHVSSHVKALQRSCPVCGVNCVGGLAAHLASVHGSLADDAELGRTILSGVDRLHTNQEAPDLSLLDALLLSPDILC